MRTRKGPCLLIVQSIKRLTLAENSSRLRIEILLLSFTEEHYQKSPSGRGCTSAAWGGAPELHIEMLVLCIAEGHYAEMRLEGPLLNFIKGHCTRAIWRGGSAEFS